MSDQRVLVAYATYAGSTADVAAEIARILGQRGFCVECRQVRENPPVEDYSAALVGSAVQYGKWLPEAVEFVLKNAEALNRVPAVLFCVHITNIGSDPNSRKTRLTFLNQVRPLVPHATEAFFAGKFDRRGAALLMPSLIARLVPTIDLRDWGKIRGWAQTVWG